MKMPASSPPEPRAQLRPESLLKEVFPPAVAETALKPVPYKEPRDQRLVYVKMPKQQEMDGPFQV